MAIHRIVCFRCTASNETKLPSDLFMSAGLPVAPFPFAESFFGQCDIMLVLDLSSMASLTTSETVRPLAEANL